MLTQKKHRQVEQNYRITYIEKGDSGRFGEYKIICHDYHKNDPLVALGPDYPICIAALLVINFISVWILIKLSGNEQARPYFLLQLVILIYLDIVWMATGLMNPGLAIKSPDDQGELCYECQQKNAVELVKKRQREHCKNCRICIDGYQQHSYLTGGCIGKNNYLIYKLFLLGLFVWGITLITTVPYIYTSIHL